MCQNTSKILISIKPTLFRGRMDSGLVIVTFITFVYIMIMFTLLFYVKYEWCDLLFRNNTVRLIASWSSHFWRSFPGESWLQENVQQGLIPDWWQLWQCGWHQQAHETQTRNQPEEKKTFLDLSFVYSLIINSELSEII